MKRLSKNFKDVNGFISRLIRKNNRKAKISLRKIIERNNQLRPKHIDYWNSIASTILKLIKNCNPNQTTRLTDFKYTEHYIFSAN